MGEDATTEGIPLVLEVKENGSYVGVFEGKTGVRVNAEWLFADCELRCG